MRAFPISILCSLLLVACAQPHHYPVATPRGDTLWLASNAYRDYAALQDTIALYGNRAQRIVAAIHPDSTSAQRQRQLMRDLDDCRQQMHEAIMRCAARNGDNALGQFIRENYLGLVPDSLPAPQQ